LLLQRPRGLLQTGVETESSFDVAHELLVRGILGLQPLNVSGACYTPPLNIVRAKEVFVLGRELIQELLLTCGKRRAACAQGLKLLQLPFEELVVPVRLHHELLQHTISGLRRV